MSSALTRQEPWWPPTLVVAGLALLDPPCPLIHLLCVCQLGKKTLACRGQWPPEPSASWRDSLSVTLSPLARAPEWPLGDWIIIICLVIWFVSDCLLAFRPVYLSAFIYFAGSHSRHCTMGTANLVNFNWHCQCKCFSWLRDKSQREVALSDDCLSLVGCPYYANWIAALRCQFRLCSLL